MIVLIPELAMDVEPMMELDELLMMVVNFWSSFIMPWRASAVSKDVPPS